jgi:RNA polymerase sigma-70 factor (ECF subfamily)
VDADRGLVDAAAAGDREAFDELVRRHQVEILNLVRALTAGGVDADDLAQEAFVRAWRGLGRFRGDSTFRTWLYGLTVNVVRTHYTKRKRFQRLFWTAGRQAEGDADPLDRAVTDPGIEDAVIMRNAIDRALATLPGELREAVTLRDVQGLDYREIANVLGVPIGTVESRIFRARQKLRPLLEPLMKRGSSA